MSGMITVSGNSSEVGREIGRYWGGYFSSLRSRRGKNHGKLFRQYKNWLKNTRENTVDLQNNVRETFPAIWEEIEGMLEGINEYSDKDMLGFEITIGGLFSCILAETDLDYKGYWGCSTSVLQDNSGYYMVHSDEYDEICPLVIANVTLNAKERNHCFTSISHPFQLFGSAAGMNDSFAFQGNSIPCSKKVFNDLKKPYKGKNRIPKTVLSRILLELRNTNDVAALYQKHPCTLPNHHVLISGQGAYSLEVKPIENNVISLKKIKLQKGKTFCHTNHFKDEDDIRWSYKKNNESKNRLCALEKSISNASESSSVERCFLKYINEYNDRSKRLLKMTSGIFCFRAPCNGKPILQKTFLHYGYSN